MTSLGPGKNLKLQVLPLPGCGGGGLGPQRNLERGVWVDFLVMGLEEVWEEDTHPPSEYCSSSPSAVSTAIPTGPWKLE